MKKNNSFGDSANLFVVDTPYQLLNAIEAVHLFQSNNNHLFVLWHKNGGQDRYLTMIKASHWTNITFYCVLPDTKHWVLDLLGATINQCYAYYIHLRKRREFDRLFAKFQKVDRIFIGHYWAKEKYYMRHIANTVRHRELYLLDDGTDTIDIAEHRKSLAHDSKMMRAVENSARVSAFKRLLEQVRQKYWQWNTNEVQNITFFTTYDITVHGNDKLVKNSYTYLKSLSPRSKSYEGETVTLLGLPIESGCFEEDFYFDALLWIRQYFFKNKILYVPHPQERGPTISRIKTLLNCEVWKSSGVIEYDLIRSGVEPKVVAGFASSALISLAQVLEPNVQIVSFYIPSDRWKYWKDGSIKFYDYLKSNENSRITVVPLACEESKQRVLSA